MEKNSFKALNNLLNQVQPAFKMLSEMDLDESYNEALNIANSNIKKASKEDQKKYKKTIKNLNKAKKEGDFASIMEIVDKIK